MSFCSAPTLDTPGSIDQLGARLSFLTGETGVASDQITAQQIYGPQFLDNNLQLLQDAIYGTRRGFEPGELDGLNAERDTLAEQLREVQLELDEVNATKGTNSKKDAKQKRLRDQIANFERDINNIEGRILQAGEDSEGQFREGGLAELYGGTELAEIARTQGLTAASARLEQMANTASRNADLDDVVSFAQRFGSDEGIRSLRTNELNQAMGRLQGLNTDLTNPIDQELNKQALAGLNGGLSDREQGNIQQASRTASEARGRLFDNQSILDETQASVLADRNRLNENRAFASGQNANSLNRAIQDRGFSVQAAQAAQGGGFDAFTAVLNRSSGAPGISQSQISNAAPFVAGTPGFDTTGGVDIALGEQANQAGLASANAGAGAAQDGANAEAAASAAAAALLFFCWVAREVYGEGNPRWMLFRDWVVNKAPSWFVRSYAVNGPAMAQYLREHPEEKPALHQWMEQKIGEL